MKTTPLSIQTTNKLVTHYKNNDKSVMKYFDYSSNQYEQKRLEYINNRTYQRQNFVEAVHKLHKKWGAPEASMVQLNKLLDEQAVAVVGGQQAGLLTGPLYSIHKIISVTQLAEEQEKKLGIPVVPIFWIAGEDHDFEEINHTYVPTTNMKMKKIKLQNKSIDAGRKSVSDLEFEKDKLREWIENVFLSLKETDYTQDIYSLVQTVLSNSNSYSEFFAKFIFQLFPNQGIILLDSHASEIREIESDFFLEMIQHQQEISASVKSTIDKLRTEEYSISLDATEDDAHLFYHDEQLGRVLLQVEKEGVWVDKQHNIRLTLEELQSIAINSPHLLSNNVVTRPMMQEKLIPTLAFVGGPGEITYWSALKDAFHILELEMPPIVPRISFTYLDRYTSRLLDKYNLDLPKILNRGVKEDKQRFLNEKNDYNIDEVTEELKTQLSDIHQPLRDIAASLGDDIKALSESNLSYLLKDIEFLRKRLNNEIKKTYAIEISEFDRLEMILRPNNGLQERIWNPIYVMNCCGVDVFSRLVNNHSFVHEEHWMIHL